MLIASEQGPEALVQQAAQFQTLWGTMNEDEQKLTVDVLSEMLGQAVDVESLLKATENGAEPMTARRHSPGRRASRR